MSSQRSECRDLCSLPPSMPGLASSTAAQGWNWQQGQPGSLQSSRLLEDDKQDLFTKSTALSQEADQRVTSHQSSRGGKNLGSAAESPTSVSSSPSPLSSGKDLSTNGVTSRLHRGVASWHPQTAIGIHPPASRKQALRLIIAWLAWWMTAMWRAKLRAKRKHAHPCHPPCNKTEWSSAQCQTVSTWQCLLVFSCR